MRLAQSGLEAEVRSTRAVYAKTEPDRGEQRDLLERAVCLHPIGRPSSFRLARACQALGDMASGREHAAEALALLAGDRAITDSFDFAPTGRNLSVSYARRELEQLGLLQLSDARRNQGSFPDGASAWLHGQPAVGGPDR